MRKQAIAMLGLAGLMFMAGCSSSGGDVVKFTDTPENLSYSAELQVFEDLGSMTASSDLVVKATVTQIGKGRTTGTAEDGGATTTREVQLHIDKVLYQKRGGHVPQTVILAEGYWDERGMGYMSEGIGWSKVGDTGYYYLSGPDDTYSTSDHYALVFSQGRILVGEAGISITGHHDHEGPWMSVDTTSLTALEASIADGVHAARTGKAKAVKPEMCNRAPEMAACKD